MSSCRYTWIAVFAIVALALSASNADAQTQMIAGKVIDDSTRQPIVDALVTLVDIYDRPKATPVRSDSTGSFTINVKQPGSYRMKAQRIGYLPQTTARFEVEEDMLQKYEIWMSQQIYLLAPLTIVERPTPISNKLEGFEFRRTTAAGFFMTREEIEQRGPTQATDLLQGIAGVRVQYDNFSASIRMIRGSTGDCTPVIYIDGIKVRLDPVETLNLIEPQHLYGLEVYRGPSQIPGDFAGSDASCGVVVVWTRRGTQ